MPDHFDICKAIRKDGRPCQNPATATGYCFAHDPGMDEARHEARVRGGQAKATAVRLEKLLPDVLRQSMTVTLRAMRAVEAKTLEPARGQAIAALTTSLTRQYLAGVQVERLTDLEAMLTAKNGAGALDTPEDEEGGDDVA